MLIIKKIYKVKCLKRVISQDDDDDVDEEEKNENN